MVNIISPFGIQDLRRRDGGSPTMGLERVNISSSDATPIYYGDIVQDLGATVGSGNFGSYITQGSSGLQSGVVPAWRGVFRGCEYFNTAVGRVVWSAWWPGGGAAGVSSQVDPIAYITQDDMMMYIAQVSSTSGAVIGSSQIGLSIGVTATASAGNTTTGYSAIALASSLIGGASSGSSLPFRILDFYSNYAPGAFPGQPATTVAAAFVNGTDNTNVGQILVIQQNLFMNRQNLGG